MVSVLGYIDSGCRSPPINKNETYECKLLEKKSDKKLNSPLYATTTKENLIKTKSVTEPVKKFNFSKAKETKPTPMKEKTPIKEKEISVEVVNACKYPIKETDDERCKSCSVVYTKGKIGINRKVYDSCMHPTCFSCLVNSKPCVACKANEFEIDDLDSIINSTINTTNNENKSVNISGKSVNYDCFSPTYENKMGKTPLFLSDPIKFLKIEK